MVMPAFLLLIEFLNLTELNCRWLNILRSVGFERTEQNFKLKYVIRYLNDSNEST